MRIYTKAYLNPCRILGCANLVGRTGYKGICKMHNMRFYYNGDYDLHPRQKQPPKQCTIHGCAEVAKTKYYCGKHNYRNKKYGNPLAKISPVAIKAMKAEVEVARLFSSKGHVVEMCKYGSSYDLLVDGILKLEVKSAGRQKDGKWCFNIHRHGKLVEVADFYILQFVGVPGQKHPIYAALKAPLKRYGLSYTLAGMIKTLAPAIDLLHTLRTGKISENNS
jgi:hypothetical protein